MASLPDLRKIDASAALKPNSHFKIDLAKKNFQSLYGKAMLSASIDKLTPVQMDFLQNTKYLTNLKQAFPKISINLNENMKNLYFFGSSTQVNRLLRNVSKFYNKLEHF